MATAAEHKVILNADASALISATNKATKSVQSLGKAQDFLNQINMRAAAAESPLQAIRVRTAQDLAKLNALYQAGQITLAQRVQGVQKLIAAERAQIASMQGVNGGVRNMRGAFGQLGYQVQDVAVQLQMGQNAFLVFAQQGSQIASIFGPGGAVVGAIMAVGGAIAMSMIPNLQQAAVEVEDLIDRFNDLVEEGLPSGIEESFGIRLNEAQIKADEKAVQMQTKSLQTLMDKRDELQKKLDTAKGGFVAGSGFLGIRRVDIESTNDAIDELDLSIANANLTILEHQASINKATAAIEGYKSAVDDDWTTEGIFKFEEEREKAIYKRSEELLQEHEKNRQELKSVGLLGEEIALKDSYTRQLELVQKYADQEIITEAEKAEAIKRINQDMQKSAVSEFSKGMDALGKYNSKAFKVAKAAKTAEAVMNTYAGATQALAAYPPPFSYIAAAGQIAFGMAQVAQIKSQTFAGRAAGGMVQAGKPYMVGEMGKEMFIPSTNGRIANNNEVEAGMGANITFNISTVDARGFGELLDSRRGQIVSMVNRAMNDRGRAGVTV